MIYVASIFKQTANQSTIPIPPMSPACCPPDSHGPVTADASKQLQGRIIKLGSIEAYVVNESSSTGKAVICGPDIFGLESGSTKEICDRVAQETGHFVILPDTNEGDPWPEKWGIPTAGLNLFWFLPWLRRHNAAKAKKVLDDHVLPYLDSKNIMGYAWFGFCMGATHCAPLSAYRNCKGGVGLHPSFNAVTAPFAGGPSMKELFGNFKSPLLALVASNDSKESKVLGPGIVRDVAKQEVVVNEYVLQKHGWVNRGDEKDPSVGPDREKALGELVGFLTKVLG